MNTKQVKLTLGITLLIQAVSCFFLTVCYLCSDKKRTAAPFALLGFVNAIAGIVLLADKLKETYDNSSIRKAVEDYCEDDFGEDFEDEIGDDEMELPKDEEADETEFC